MIEAVVAVALAAIGIGAVMGGALAVAHQTAGALPRAALTLEAQNVLTDLRAATAYDARELAALTGQTAAFDVSNASRAGSAPPMPLHITVGIVRTAGAAPLVATVTVRDAQGRTVTVQSTLVQEAPAPESVVPAGAPTPADAAPSDTTPVPSTPPGTACQAEPAVCRARGPIRL